MSQDVSNNLGTGQTVIPPSGLWSVETDADHLMNDLFSDLDEILEKGRKLPEESQAPEYVSLQSVIVPSINLPSPPKLEQESFSQQVQTGGNSAKVGTEVPKSKSSSEGGKSGSYFDKILFVIACGSLLAVLIWLVSEERLKIPSTWNWAQNRSESLSDSDAEFIEYMERSLDVIDRKAQLEQPSSVASLPPGTPPSTANVPPTSTQTPTVLERIYIPVYPTNPSSPASPDSPASPEAASPSPAQPSPTTAQTTPEPSPIPPPPPANVIPSIPVETAPPPPSAPATKHTLVGLLELGERSAALFNIDGVTQRIRIGEPIGGSGWTLVSVANQKAVIRRNGEVRSIFVGQSF